MARKQITQLIDDLNGEPIEQGGETVLFSLDGRAYEIDLSDANSKALRDAFAPYVDVARPVGGASRRNSAGVSRRPRGAGRDLAAIREWARANGHSVNERGRLSTSVLEAYDAVH